jgi:hypothetical protein
MRTPEIVKDPAKTAGCFLDWSALEAWFHLNLKQAPGKTKRGPAMMHIYSRKRGRIKMETLTSLPQEIAISSQLSYPAFANTFLTISPPANPNFKHIP